MTSHKYTDIYNMDSEKKLRITPEQAKTLLTDSERIHTFRSLTGILLGCDWDKSSIVEELERNTFGIEIGGEQCKRMGHGLVIWTSHNDPLFVEADKDRIKEMEDQLLK